MCFVWISEQTAIISLYSINWLVCITGTECVYCAVRADCITIEFRLLFVLESLTEPGGQQRLKAHRTPSARPLSFLLQFPALQDIIKSILWHAGGIDKEGWGEAMPAIWLLTPCECSLRDQNRACISNFHRQSVTLNSTLFNGCAPSQWQPERTVLSLSAVFLPPRIGMQLDVTSSDQLNFTSDVPVGPGVGKGKSAGMVGNSNVAIVETESA